MGETKQQEKPQQIKIPLKLIESIMDVLPISDSEIKAAKDRWLILLVHYPIFKISQLKISQSCNLFLVCLFNQYLSFRIAEFERKEREKALREEAHHDLESLVVDLGDKLTQDEFTVLVFSVIFRSKLKNFLMLLNDSKFFYRGF